MTATMIPVSVSGMAKRKAPTQTNTDQINFRFPVPLIERMERYKERHQLHPTLTQIAVTALNEWLDKHEPELPKASR